ncbi:MAG: hypothetical protein OIF36_03400 [Alphaproteobacteria bacterium]|nr:hypothetical protein [Alphaproteobacteria bacterium]
MPKKKKVNVITIKWGTAYKAEEVNRLYNMVKKNTTFDVNFYCFTEKKKGLDKNIIVKPLPKMNMKLADCKYAYRKEAGLCDDNLGDLNGQRVLFFDLDMVITDNIDDFFTLPKKDEFYIINDWHTNGTHVGQASCYSWKVGTLGYIKSYFEKNHKECIDKFYTASQEYLSSKVIEKYGNLNFWPEKWCKSFRFHCLPIGILRRFISPKLPEGAKILAFHGSPKVDDAIAGIWGGHKDALGKKKNIWWKKLLYKNLRPATWVKEYF